MRQTGMKRTRKHDTWIQKKATRRRMKEDIEAIRTDKKRNKDGYTATPVACVWAGAVFELLKHLGRSSEAKDGKNHKQVAQGQYVVSDTRCPALSDCELE